MKEIPETRFLVSISYTATGGANLEMFDLKDLAKVKKVYSFREAVGSKPMISNYSISFLFF